MYRSNLHVAPLAQRPAAPSVVSTTAGDVDSSRLLQLLKGEAVRLELVGSEPPISNDLAK